MFMTGSFGDFNVEEIEVYQLKDEGTTEPTNKNTAPKNQTIKTENSMGINKSFVPLKEMSILTNYLKENKVLQNNKLFYRIYKGTEDGLFAHVFHQKCDGKKNILVLLKANGYIFGGYNPCSFESVGDWVNCSGAFIFSLSNPENNPLKFSCFQPQSSFYDHPNYGPTFGEDITIGQDFADPQFCYSELGHSYEGKPILFYIFIYFCFIYFIKSKIMLGGGYVKGSYESQLYFCDKINFALEEIEVYQLMSEHEIEKAEEKRREFERLKIFEKEQEERIRKEQKERLNNLRGGIKVEGKLNRNDFGNKE